MEKKIAIRVSVVTLIVNIVLSIIKLFVGVVGKSSAMVSDAVHSASDVFSTVIVMVGITVSNKEADYEHQYGHEKLESIASIVLSIILVITGAGIGIDGILLILSDRSEIAIPSGITLYVAILSILVKEWMYWYTKSAANKIKSDVLLADAWHHRTDAFTSIGSFIGILGARMGYAILEPIASVLICVFIIKAAYDIFIQATDKTVDKSCDEETINNIKEIVFSVDGVLDIDDLKTRMFGNKIYIDIEIATNGEMKLTDAHDIAHKVHDKVEEIEGVKHCMVHVNPYVDKKE